MNYFEKATRSLSRFLAPFSGAEGEIIKPLRDWKIILVGSAVLFIAAVAFNIFLFFSLSDEEERGASASNPVRQEAAEREKLEDIVAQLQERKRQFSEIEARTRIFTDPSR